jgi:hypothetical protein
VRASIDSLDKAWQPKLYFSQLLIRVARFTEKMNMGGVFSLAHIHFPKVRV